MKAPGFSVVRADGEKVRRLLSDGGRLRTDLRIRSAGDRVVLPLTDGPPPRMPGGTIVESEFEPVRAARPRSYREYLDLSPTESALLPSAYDVVGDIVLLRLPRPLEGRAAEIGEALLRFVPGARLVGLDRGVRGPKRVRTLERIAGLGPWSTRHRENGLSIEVDLERAYFSPRLAGEHARVARAVTSGERILDLCCGVGPFSLAIARDGRAASLIAVDSNPDAIRLLGQNAARLGLGDRIHAIEAELGAFLPSAKTAARIVLNLPREGIIYLPQVATLMEPAGTLHYYEFTERSRIDRRPAEIAKHLADTNGRWVAEPARVVHPYSPSEDLVAYQLLRVGS